MASCSLCVSHEPIEIQSNKLDQAVEVHLPYYREITNYIPYPQAKSNYTSYHLFCLKKNITPFICEIDSAYEVGFSSREIADAMVLVLDIYKGGEKIILSSDILDLIQSNLNKFIDLYPYCLVYDISFDQYPKEWLEKVLPEIKCGIFQSNSIFINLEGDAGYSRKWDETYSNIDIILSRWYKEGVISLNQISKKNNFIRDWRLVPVTDKLYKPDWDFDFTPDKVNFLLDQLKGNKRLMLFIGENDQIETQEGWLIKNVDNYSQVEEILNQILVI